MPDIQVSFWKYTQDKLWIVLNYFCHNDFLLYETNTVIPFCYLLEFEDFGFNITFTEYAELFRIKQFSIHGTNSFM